MSNFYITSDGISSTVTVPTGMTPPAPQDEILHREYEATLEPTGDGRTLDLRIVPFNTPTVVRDNGGPEYEEEWLPGCFDKQLGAANRVLVNFEHEPGFPNVIGRGVELRSSEKALDGTFRILLGPDGDKALELVNEKVLTGVSLEAIPQRTERGADGVVRRVKARLINIALCRSPAYKEAAVLAVREGEPEEPGEPEPTPEPEPEPEPVPAARAQTESSAPAVDELLDRVEELIAAWAQTESSAPAVDELLDRVGVTPLVRRAVTREPWDRTASRFTDEQWRDSCILDRGEQLTTVKQRFALPVLEPNGALNTNAMHAAAAMLAGARGGVSAQEAQKALAARRLLRYYRQAGESAPHSLANLGGR